MNYLQLPLLCSMLFCTHLCAISIVYNFRIAQITKQPITEDSHNRKHSLIALLFDVDQKKYNGVHQNFAGALGSYIYNFDSYYLRTDIAGSYVQEITDHIITFSGAQADDILFTLGRNFKLNDKTVMTLSGLFGVPTHEIVSLRHVGFGYSQTGIGIQCDGSYALHHDDALLYGARYIRFVPRSAQDTVGQCHIFTIGNIGDILFAYKNNLTPKHGLEGGYTMRSQFGANICPNLDDIVQKTNYLRSNFYLVYKYKFLIGKVANRLLFNIAYGFDHHPKVFGNKSIITLWASWNIRF